MLATNSFIKRKSFAGFKSLQLAPPLKSITIQLVNWYFLLLLTITYRRQWYRTIYRSTLMVTKTIKTMALSLQSVGTRDCKLLLHPRRRRHSH